MKILIEESILRQALEILSQVATLEEEDTDILHNTITALRSALDAAKKVEPVIWKIDAPDAFWFQDSPDDSENDEVTSTPLYDLRGLK